ncbi:hypothetical protein CTI12_AA577830 [Artemisia annua]|uniref:Pentatricopeptide repeat-containing protein n=1 Tax=Artemisia annua TaxID=35608 RepID=A0A2U1KPY0_ARTAN|nr:hypothetical protein CTI12_AA577830 [Artemisia annua]
MQKCGVKPDRQFYNVMIDTFGKYNCLDNALEILERMRNDGIEPDTVTWNTLIDCHCKCGYHSKAEELFDEMQKIVWGTREVGGGEELVEEDEK